MKTEQIILHLQRLQKQAQSLQLQQFRLSDRIDALSPSQIRKYVTSAIIEAWDIQRNGLKALDAQKEALQKQMDVHLGIGEDLEIILKKALAVQARPRKDPATRKTKGKKRERVVSRRRKRP